MFGLFLSASAVVYIGEIFFNLQLRNVKFISI